MASTSTFSSRLVGGFALTVGLALLMGAASVTALTTVTSSKDDVIRASSEQLSESLVLGTVAEQRIADYRAYLLNPSADNLKNFTADRTAFLDKIKELRARITDPVTRRLLDAVAQAEGVYTAALEPVVERRRSLTSLADITQLNASQVPPARRALKQAIAELSAGVQTDLDQARRASSRTATRSIILIGVLVGLSVVSATLIAYRLSRGLRREVGSAVSHIQSSSAQLEAAAATQAVGGQDQSSAMNEITATINELMITSRLIADNAQRVSKIAEDTTQAARSGDATIDQTRQSIAEIRSQMDEIVRHMLALGEKSQQIGGVVELVSELAEQTNILAINATIEASGAGEWGRRFAVVAEEIRKLADRTAVSAKEIRSLIDDIREAVQTTVKATEFGARAVDNGVLQVDHATTSFRRIADLVSTATDASREIELTTKQQSTAVEQVNVAASDTARVTRETEASAMQTRQTASHLTSLSGDLQRLVGAASG
ncbi:methyl-accepting chemotaxis protein [Actinoplanes sp. NPDC051861]|uniref:HAMP domain-containing methyl-accepting chemotaxis protein n=1 Tax=Actinoplanes sp. NPDC051861 TaxID=3155170 RepID=UPI003416FA96